MLFKSSFLTYFEGLWCFKKQLFTITSDNGTNMIKAGDLLNKFAETSETEELISDGFFKEVFTLHKFEYSRV
jgi:hypothetical protein